MDESENLRWLLSKLGETCEAVADSLDRICSVVNIDGLDGSYSDILALWLFMMLGTHRTKITIAPGNHIHVGSIRLDWSSVPTAVANLLLAQSWGDWAGAEAWQ